MIILLNRDGPREFDCPRFVIESTDQIWNMYRGIYKQSINLFELVVKKTFFFRS